MNINEAHGEAVERAIAETKAVFDIAPVIAAYLAAMEAAGFVMMPVEALPEMLGAFWRVKNGSHFHDEPAPTDTSDMAAYAAMIACRPRVTL